MNIYQENGYDSRADYLQCLADEYGVPVENVKLIANLYGPTEDFDGLIAAMDEMETSR